MRNSFLNGEVDGINPLSSIDILLSAALTSFWYKIRSAQGNTIDKTERTKKPENPKFVFILPDFKCRKRHDCKQNSYDVKS